MIQQLYRFYQFPLSEWTEYSGEGFGVKCYEYSKYSHIFYAVTDVR
jgi:hypothetical protein